MCQPPKEGASTYYYRPRSEASEGYVFTGICHSVIFGGGEVATWDMVTTPPSPLGPGHNTSLPPLDQVTTPPSSPWDQVTTPPPPRPGHNTSLLPPGTRSQHLPPSPLPGTRSQHLPSPRDQVTTPPSPPWDQVTTPPPGTIHRRVVRILLECFPCLAKISRKRLTNNNIIAKRINVLNKHNSSQTNTSQMLHEQFPRLQLPDIDK